MQKTVYTHAASGQSWDYLLPKVLRHDGKSVMGITEDNMARFGIVKTVVELPDPPQPDLSEPLVAKEAAFASALKQAATSLSVDLAGLPEINVQALMAAAVAAGADETTIGLLSARLSALCLDVMAESGRNWAETWRGLKSRLPGYLND
jgi:hypothetical protein